MDQPATINSTMVDIDIEINVPFAIFLIALILVTITMNLGTIVAFWKLPSLRSSPSELLILNLACSDFLTGTIVLPLLSPTYITPGRWPFGEVVCAFMIFFVDVSVHGSLFSLVTISLDRFLLVFLEYPQYIKNLTRRRAYKVIASSWIFAIITGIIEVAFWEKSKTVDESAALIDHSKFCLSPPRRVQSFSLSFFLVLYLFPVILVCTLSVAFLYQLRLRLTKTRRSLKQLSGGQSSSSSQIHASNTGEQTSLSAAKYIENESSTGTPSDVDVIQGKPIASEQTDNAGGKRKDLSDARIRSRYIKPAIILVGLVTAMAVCMLPLAFYVIIIESGCQHCINPEILFGLALMQMCNAAIDPFIYVLTRRKIRQFYRSYLFKCET